MLTTGPTAPDTRSGPRPRLTATSLWPLASTLGLALALLSGCATRRTDQTQDQAQDRQPPAAWAGRDGPDPHPPANLDRVPDAEPRIEPVPPGGPNKPYEALGQSYTPLRDDLPLTEHGLATWYGRKFHGRRTSSGEPYDMYAMTAAHATLPIPSYARVRNPANNREVVVRINDRGPFHSGRIIDLSYTAALKLGVLRGAAPVEVQRITFEDIRTGAWRRPVAPTLAGGTGDIVALAVRAPAADITTMPIAPSASSSTATPMAQPGGDAQGEALRAHARTPADPTAVVDLAAIAAAPTFAPTPALVAALVAAPAAAASAEGSVEGSAWQALTDATAAVDPAGRGPGFWLQLGAFRDVAGAAVLQQQVAAMAGWLAPQLSVVLHRSLYRVQAGPYDSRAAASIAAQRVRRESTLSPMLVERLPLVSVAPTR